MRRDGTPTSAGPAPCTLTLLHSTPLRRSRSQPKLSNFRVHLRSRLPSGGACGSPGCSSRCRRPSRPRPASACSGTAPEREPALPSRLRERALLHDCTRAPATDEIADRDPSRRLPPKCPRPQRRESLAELDLRGHTAPPCSRSSPRLALDSPGSLAARPPTWLHPLDTA